MKLTNKFDLPAPIVEAVKNDPYNSGDCDISTTRLISPPRIVELNRIHADEIEEDVSDRIWSLMGQSVHVLLERSAKGGIVAEKRFFAECDGWKISGAVDLMDGTTLVDYKITSVWTIVYGSRIEEWEQQANINAWLARQNGVVLKDAYNIALLRDWTKKFVGDPRMPQCQVAKVPLTLWSEDKQDEFVRQRVALHQAARATGDLPVCSDEERWLNKGKYIRCEQYCQASKFCDAVKTK